MGGGGLTISHLAFRVSQVGIRAAVFPPLKSAVGAAGVPCPAERAPAPPVGWLGASLQRKWAAWRCPSWLCKQQLAPLTRPSQEKQKLFKLAHPFAHQNPVYEPNLHQLLQQRPYESQVFSPTSWKKTGTKYGGTRTSRPAPVSTAPSVRPWMLPTASSYFGPIMGLQTYPAQQKGGLHRQARPAAPGAGSPR